MTITINAAQNSYAIGKIYRAWNTQDECVAAIKAARNAGNSMGGAPVTLLLKDVDGIEQTIQMQPDVWFAFSHGLAGFWRTKLLTKKFTYNYKEYVSNDAR